MLCKTAAAAMAIVLLVAAAVLLAVRHSEAEHGQLGRFAGFQRVAACIDHRDLPTLEREGYRVALNSPHGVDRAFRGERTLVITAAPTDGHGQPFVLYLIYERSLSAGITASEIYSRFAGSRMLEGLSGNWFSTSTSATAGAAVSEMQQGCVPRLTRTTDADLERAIR